jgi:hypothetical protein
MWRPTIATNLGLAYTLSGRLPAAVALLEEAVEQAAQMKLMLKEMDMRPWFERAHAETRAQARAG